MENTSNDLITLFGEAKIKDEFEFIQILTNYRGTVGIINSNTYI